MTLAIFPGCLVTYRYPEYEKSAYVILEKLGLKGMFIPEFTCCGSQVLESVDEKALTALSARNLAIAQSHGVNTLVALCGSCTFELLRAKKEMEEGERLSEINEVLGKEGLEYKPDENFNVMHIVEFLTQKGLFEKIGELKRDDIDVRVAIQEPCNASRPLSLHPGMDCDSFNRKLRGLIDITGASICDFAYERRCCGGTMLAFDEEVGRRLVALRYAALKESGADFIINACPNCQVVYYLYPFVVDKKYRKKESRLPSALFFTQLVGLCLGAGLSELGLERHRDRGIIKEMLENRGGH